MHSVLLQEDLVRRVIPAANLSIQVSVTVHVISEGHVAFEPHAGADYTVEEESIKLVGSGGSPREFLVTFQLADESIQQGYTFANPALKFFQGSSRNAGFRVSPTDQHTASVSLFNTMNADDRPASDDFSMLFYKASGRIFTHDPTIIWDPPGGGA